MSKREIRLPKLSELRKKRAANEKRSRRRGRAAAVLRVPDEVGEQKTVTEKGKREQAAATSPRPSHREASLAEGVVTSVPVSDTDGLSRPLHVPDHLRAQYGRETSGSGVPSSD